MSLVLQNSFSLKACAKINLFLYIKGKREDGYHLLETLMVPVSLYDEIRLDFYEGREIIFDDNSTGDIPFDERNLAWKGANLFLEKLNLDIGVKIKINKKIPVAAGLGGGSSDCASVLSGLNLMTGSPFDTKELRSIGVTLGADVPFFIDCRPSICKGIGDLISPVDKFKKRYLILVNPGTGLSTSEIYKNLNWGLTNRVKKNKRLLVEDCLSVKSELINDLQSVSEERNSEIAEIIAMLEEFDAEIAMMSGSGPTCFGVYENREKRDESLSLFLKNSKSSWKVFSAEFI